MRVSDDTRAVLEELVVRERIRPQFVPTDDQAPFFASPAKFRGFIGGVGSGKSFAGAVESWDAVIDYPGNLHVITAPTWGQIKAYSAKTFFAVIGTSWDDAESHEFIEAWNRTDGLLTLANGSQVMFLSADSPDRFIGFEAGSFWFDEPAESRYGGAVFRNLMERLRNKRGPRKGWITGTPGGYDWIYDRFENEDATNTLYLNRTAHKAELFRGSTLSNPHTPDEYRQLMRDTYGSTALGRARLYGEFVTYAGAVFPALSHEHHMLPDFVPDPDVPVVMSADFGVDGPTVWLWAQEYPWGIVIFDELHAVGQPVSTIAEAVNDRNAASGFVVEAYYGDVAGKQRGPNLDSYVTLYAKDGIDINVKPAGRIKTGCEAIMRMLKNPTEGDVPELFFAQGAARTFRHASAYHYPSDDEGNPTSDTPEKDGINDHDVDTLRYLLAHRRPELFRRDARGTPTTGGTRKTAPSSMREARPVPQVGATAAAGGSASRLRGGDSGRRR